ncbi:cytochrome c [Bradyrhizobium sp. STM 3843]|uniref:cytochrome c n=1 Tax=unclassified Bradyrhizobium TaxID=2631580 RepID=UPI000560CE08|nr:cytochrome c [Bradyrhizobium sp. STM 3843]
MRHHLTSMLAVPFLLASVSLLESRAADLTDKREPVSRTEAERTFVLDQMRLFLTSVAAIEEGLGSGDLDRVAQEAAARGRKANAGLARPPTLAAKESDAWKMMIGQVRGGFDEIAAQAAANAPPQQINATLGKTMQNCVACHQSYRIKIED